ncbi:hypothetical protein [Hasllibacter sp. MH4015]|uniref:hypothetical protein n=1 Tax=Hasllibacter sp. MH4015 TaxID=2854029 RepID=UPI001CD2A2F2|nr:hypothetical protein [Hasllibacter sp. MH4015]
MPYRFTIWQSFERVFGEIPVIVVRAKRQAVRQLGFATEPLHFHRSVPPRIPGWYSKDPAMVTRRFVAFDNDTFVVISSSLGGLVGKAATDRGSACT